MYSHKLSSAEVRPDFQEKKGEREKRIGVHQRNKTFHSAYFDVLEGLRQYASQHLLTVLITFLFCMSEKGT